MLNILREPNFLFRPLFPRHLPATLLASFVKRLSRLSLTAPPSSIVITIPFVYNILKHHPTLMCMIHRDGEVPQPYEGELLFPTHLQLLSFDFCIDPFLVDEPNPNMTNALDSSLWELYSHKNHYHAAVSTLARIFEEAFTKPSYPMEDFLDHTYATVRLPDCRWDSSKLELRSSPKSLSRESSSGVLQKIPP
jgi:U3 small nucleolar RNA-associated protein 19